MKYFSSISLFFIRSIRLKEVFFEFVIKLLFVKFIDEVRLNEFDGLLDGWKGGFVRLAGDSLGELVKESLKIGKARSLRVIADNARKRRLGKLGEDRLNEVKVILKCPGDVQYSFHSTETGIEDIDSIYKAALYLKGLRSYHRPYLLYLSLDGLDSGIEAGQTLLDALDLDLISFECTVYLLYRFIDVGDAFLDEIRSGDEAGQALVDLGDEVYDLLVIGLVAGVVILGELFQGQAESGILLLELYELISDGGHVAQRGVSPPVHDVAYLLCKFLHGKDIRATRRLKSADGGRKLKDLASQCSELLDIDFTFYKFLIRLEQLFLTCKTSADGSNLVHYLRQVVIALLALGKDKLESVGQRSERIILSHNILKLQNIGDEIALIIIVITDHAKEILKGLDSGTEVIDAGREGLDTGLHTVQTLTEPVGDTLDGILDQGAYLLLGLLRRLLQLGLKPEKIDLSDECTVCCSDKYWSARYTARNGLKRGSLSAGIVLGRSSV